MSILLRHEKDVDNVEYREGVRDKQDDKPVSMREPSGFPQRVPFPRNRPERDKNEDPCLFLHECNY